MKPPMHNRSKWGSPTSSGRDAAVLPAQVRVDRTKPSPASSVSGPLSQSSLSPMFAAAATTSAIRSSKPETSPSPPSAMRQSGPNSKPSPAKRNRVLTFDGASPRPSKASSARPQKKPAGTARASASSQKQPVGFEMLERNDSSDEEDDTYMSMTAKKSEATSTATVRNVVAPAGDARQSRVDSSSDDDDSVATAAAGNVVAPAGAALCDSSSDVDDDSDDDDDDDRATFSRRRTPATTTAAAAATAKVVAPAAAAPLSVFDSSSDEEDSSSDDDSASFSCRRTPATTTTSTVSASSSSPERKRAAAPILPSTAEQKRTAAPTRSDVTLRTPESANESRARAVRTGTNDGGKESDDNEEATEQEDENHARRSVAPSRLSDGNPTNPSRSRAKKAEPAAEATPDDVDEVEEEEGKEEAPLEAGPSPPLERPPRPEVRDRLWADDDDDPVVPEKPKSKKKPAPKRAAAAKSRGASPDEIASASSESGGSRGTTNRRRTGAASSGGQKPSHKGRDSGDDPDDSDDEDPATAHLKLHPNIEHPAFGPFEEEPLVLEKGSDRPFQVPTSINRYLLEYQQEGIQFMFDKCIEMKGAILGDDMGLGKTIQVIGLFAALLEKTGTKIDTIELKRRKKLVEDRVQQIRLAENAALRAGNIFTPPDIASDIGVPAWCPILVVVPVVLEDQWMSHLKTWGHFASETFTDAVKCGLERVRNGVTEIVVCRDSQFMKADYVKLLAAVQWKLVVIDEFHKFKNDKTNLATNLRVLRSMVDELVVVGLTGTLMQNEHKELWNLIDLVQPDLLGTWDEFKFRVADPIKQGQKKYAPREVKEYGERVSALFKAETLPKVFLRRTKEDKLREILPTKDEIIVFCELSKTQKEIYSYILKQPDFVLLSHANGPCDCSANDEVFREYKLMKTKAQRVDFMRRNKGRITRRCKCHYRCPWDKSSPDGIAANAVLWRQVEDHGQQSGGCQKCPWCIGLPALAILYRLVSHVSLLQVEKEPASWTTGTREHVAATKEYEKAKAFLPPKLIAEGKIPGGLVRASTWEQRDLCELSGKLTVLKKLVKRIKKQNGRVLIFSAYTTVLNVIEKFLTLEVDEDESYSCLRMDGKTTRVNRNKYKDEFKRNPKIFAFLLSTKAMGLGLDLTEANNVIIFDVEWNPSWDAQAQDRAYRIGQTQNVTVYRLVARGTIEELKYLRQIYKTQLIDQTITSNDEQSSDVTTTKEFRGVAGDQDNKGELFGMANLLKFRDGTFMSYNSSRSSKADSTMDQVVFDDLLATVRETSEDDLYEDDQLAAMDALVKRQAGAPNNYSDGDESYDDEDYGAESQVNMGIMDRAEVAFDLPKPDQAPTSRGSTVHRSSPRAEDEPCPAPDVVGSSNRASSKRSVAASMEAPCNAEDPPEKDFTRFFVLPSQLKELKKRKVS